MPNQSPEKLDLRSMDITDEKKQQLKQLFPEVFREDKVDFDHLKRVLGEWVDPGKERFGLQWPGKAECMKTIQQPSIATLRPDREESVNFDETENLFIEGDNLEVLKLLQKSYFGKVKMIYIDPPYNTGKDFVYKDDFKDNLANYQRLTGQRDEEGNPLITNTDSAGRFHSNWLNMMYPRLKLARNLLRDDGLIFISIDETEVANLTLLCNTVFGGDNFIEQIAWKNKYGSGALSKGFANVHEYILVYSKGVFSNIAAPLDDEQRKAYKNKDENYEVRGGYITQPLATNSKDERPNLRYPIVHNGVEIWPKKQWIWSKERVDEAYVKGEIVINERNGKYSFRTKQYLRDENGTERLGKPISL